MPSPNQIIAVGMSGGVDSSVAALLLKQQGYDVVGLFMKNWEEEDAEGVCSAAQDYADVAAVCAQIDIPHYSVNFSTAYRERVFEQFLAEYRQGLTPNPDILCNREIKFKLFFEMARREIGAGALATGHYCQIVHDQGRTCLHQGADPHKDQSYFLYTLREEVLQHVLFPIGHLPKSQVRRIAQEAGLVTAAKKDSTGICFIGKRDFRPFLSRYLQATPGPLETPQGERVGTHQGMSFYTIGQRKGLGIGGAGAPWFVVGKDPRRNAVIVVQGEDHPALYHSALTAVESSWVNDEPPFPLHCQAKIRYRAPSVACRVEQEAPDCLRVTFEQPQKAITPRQSIVFYQGSRCLGGAIIQGAIS